MQMILRHGAETHTEAEGQVMPPNAPWTMWLRSKHLHIRNQSKERDDMTVPEECSARLFWHRAFQVRDKPRLPVVGQARRTNRSKSPSMREHLLRARRFFPLMYLKIFQFETDESDGAWNDTSAKHHPGPLQAARLTARNAEIL